MEQRRHQELECGVPGPSLRAITNYFNSKRCLSHGEREPVQRVCSVCYDLWQPDLGYESRGYAPSGEGKEDDDQVDLWSYAAEQENE